MDCWTALILSELTAWNTCPEVSSSGVFSLGYLPVPYAEGSLLLCKIVNRALSGVQVNICQYVVFIIKLILSYVPVRLLYSLPTSPLTCLRS